MKNSIYKKIRSRMMHTLIIAVMVLMIIMAAGLLITRNNLISIINTHSDSVAQDAREALTEQAEDILERFTQNQAALIDEQLAIIVSYVEQMSYIATAALSSSANYRSTLNEITETVLAAITGSASGDFRIACYYGTEQGDFFVPRNYKGDHPPSGFDPRLRPWYTQTKENNALTWTEIYEDVMGRGLAITCAKPFYDRYGNTAGVAGLGVIINNFNKILVSSNVNQLSRAFILDDLGQIVLSGLTETDNYRIMPGQNLLNESSETLKHAAAQIISSKTGTERAAVNGNEVFIAFHSLKAIPWYFVIFADVNEITAPARQIETNIIDSMNSALGATDFTVMILALIEIIVVLLAVFTIIQLSSLLAKTITKPIQKMTEDAALIGGGKFDHALEVKTGDELEILSDAFNAMIKNVRATKVEKERADERANLMLNSAPFGVNFLERNHSIIDCNQAALNMFGVTDKEEYKTNFHNYSPEYQPNGALSEIWKSKCLEEVLEKPRGKFDWTHLTPEGELLPCEVTIVRSSYEGRQIFIAYMRDMREKLAAIAEKDKAIEEKNALSNLKNIMNGLDIMIYVTDPATGEILFVNDSMKRHYGIDYDCVGQLCYKIFQKELIKKCRFCPCYQLDLDPDNPVIWEEHSQITNRIYRNIDRYIDWPDGKTVHMQHSIDMTELVAAKEQAEQSSKSKSIFLSHMSHEIRTPMNAILGIAEIQLQKEDLSYETGIAFAKIYESGDLLLNIINDILDLSKIEAGKLELVPVVYDIPSLINDTAQINRLRYESKPIDFSVNVDENTPYELCGDELRIKQILNNILSNAFKYTDKGKIDFNVFCEDTDEPENVMLIFSVSDTGQGMSEDQLKRLFEEYSRFNLETNRTTVGAGLGMSITRRLIDIMNGEIDIKSEVGKGSVFTVRILQKREGAVVCGAELSNKLRDFRFRKTAIMKKVQFIREYMPYGSVLVVDDVESNLFVAKGMLIPYGLKIDTSSSGIEALEKIKNGGVYDIIFMDHMMPKMDGIETVKKIRALGYTNSIIALTANALIGQSEIFLKNGFDGYISKPIDSRELNVTLTDLIRDKKPPEVIEEARKQQLERKDKNITDFEKNPLMLQEMKKLFILDAENTIKVLENIDFNSKNPDIDSFITTVHGIKSALYNLGETDFSNIAFRLEQAGINSDLNSISNETPAFIVILKSLVQKYMPEETDSEILISGVDISYLREKLNLIKEACAAYDKKTAKELLDDLKKKEWTKNINSILEEIALNLLHSAFKRAIAAADSCLKAHSR